MDSPGEDDEITLLKQSKKFLKELGEAFDRIEEVKSERELDAIIKKLEPYQEDPQLLDTELGNFVPLLSNKFLHHLQDAIVLQNLSRILYTFCKVRGEKVIVGLLNNEPRWIEPLLDVFGRDDLSWEQNYILLLWLSHLMLSPFDLATISSFSNENAPNGVVLPQSTPSIASQCVQIGVKHLSAPTIERKAASALLVKLCIRVDMLKLDLLGTITSYAITACTRAAKDAQIHACLGALTLLSGMVASADQKMLGSHLEAIFRLSQRILEEETFSSIKSSALARKLVIKIMRNTVVHCLQAETSDLDTTEVVEQVIGTLIELLADSDTPVRMAAAKALSGITLKLEAEMAAEVIEAINGSFREELIENDAKSLFSVNAAKWHGITLTFGHLLHKRAVAQEQIPDVLRSILYALGFEQRSTSNKSTGANVRDAANYGLWAVARRCTTEELKSIPAASFAVDEHIETSSSIQYIALNLLDAACFDPDGNVRRGSSAALQELIGRHPNMVVEGINLVQIVDYQAVGLRGRAGTKVALAAARLHELYETTLTEALFSWRGLAAASMQNRSDSAVFAGMLITPQDVPEMEAEDFEPDLTLAVLTAEMQFTRIRNRLAALRVRDQEERQGLILAASWILSALNFRLVDIDVAEAGLSPVLQGMLQAVFQAELLSAQEFAFVLSEDFRPRATRSELVISATLRLLGQISAFVVVMLRFSNGFRVKWSKQRHFELLSRCLTRGDDIVLDQVPAAITLSMPMLSPKDATALVQGWLHNLAPENKKIGVRESAKILALGAAFVNLPVIEGNFTNDETYEAILDFLLQRYLHVDTDARIVVLQAVNIILNGFSSFKTPKQMRLLGLITTMLLLALNDYTISDRGDVGSLVRLAALTAVKSAYSHGLLLPSATEIEATTHLQNLQLGLYAEASDAVHIMALIARLSFEKLDKIRLAAKDTAHNGSLAQGSDPSSKGIPPAVQRYLYDKEIVYLMSNGAPIPPHVVANHDIASTSYFHEACCSLASTGDGELIKLRMLEGICSTAGGAGLGASQNLLNVREALHHFLAASQDNRFRFMQLMKRIIEINVELDNDQRLVSILETLAFAANIGLLTFTPETVTLASNTNAAKTFLTSIQRAHYKSRNIVKLQICLDVYRGLANEADISLDVIKLIVNMLLHPIPAIRIAAAETVVCLCTSEKQLKVLVSIDWTRPAADLKTTVIGLRKTIDSITA